MPESIQKPRYLLLAFVAVVLATLTMLAFKDFLPHLDRSAGGFGYDRLNILALAGLLFVDVLFMGFLAYRFIFPRFRAYQGESLEAEGRLFENLTDELRAPLYDPTSLALTTDQVAVLTERRKVSQFQFTIRCVRLLFCLLALFALLSLAQHVLTVAMLAVPGAPPSSVPL